MVPRVFKMVSSISKRPSTVINCTSSKPKLMKKPIANIFLKEVKPGIKMGKKMPKGRKRTIFPTMFSKAKNRDSLEINSLIVLNGTKLARSKFWRTDSTP